MNWNVRIAGGAALLFLVLFVRLGSLSLWDQDEAAYAGFGSRMIETGNWIIPEFPWSELHRKPPLHFWAIAASFAAFGINEFSLRLESALSVCLLFVLIYHEGKKLWGKEVALTSACVLGTSLLVPALGHVALTDGALLLFVTLSMLSWLQVMQDGPFHYVILFWLGFSLALLTKGPPVVMVTGMAAALSLFSPRRTRLLRFHPWFFLPLAVLPALTWGWLAWKIDGGEFIRWMLDWYVLRRAAGGSVFGQWGPPGYYLVSFLLFFLPWLAWLPAASLTAFRSIWNRQDPPFLLLIWLVAGWAIFEFVPSKLPTYAVMAHVPLAVFVAREFEAGTVPAKLWRILQAGFFLLIGIGLLVGPWYLQFGTKAIFACVPSALLALLAGILSFRETRQTFFLAFCVKACFLIGVFGFSIPAMDELKNATRRCAEVARQLASGQEEVIVANRRASPPSLIFYLERQGVTWLEVYDLQALKRLAAEPQKRVFILNSEQADELRKANLLREERRIEGIQPDRTAKVDYVVARN